MKFNVTQDSTAPVVKRTQVEVLPQDASKFWLTATFHSIRTVNEI